jgi:hypothetical protein
MVCRRSLRDLVTPDEAWQWRGRRGILYTDFRV